MKTLIRRIAAFCLAVCLLPVWALAEEAEPVKAQPTPYPAKLQMVVEYEEWTAEDGRVTEVGIPVTCRRDPAIAVEQIHLDAVCTVKNGVHPVGVFFRKSLFEMIVNIMAKNREQIN